MPPEGIPIASEKELSSVLHFLEPPSKPDLMTMQALWRGHEPEAWAGHPEIYRLLAQRILKLGEPLLAFDVVAEGIKSNPRDVHLRQLHALALARSGAAGAANAVLAELYQDGHRDEETLGLLARTHKDLAREAPDVSEAHQHLQRAYEFYSQAYEATGGYWTGINAATLALLGGNREPARALARQISEQCRRKLNEGAAEERYWLLSTLGEAALLVEDWPQAEQWYGQAVEAGRGDWGSLRSTWHNARVLMQHLGAEKDSIERLFRFPSVVVFTGHMIDRPGRKVPRFPPQLETAVQEAIRERLQNSGAGFGYASGACGSDILFLEAIRELQGETHIILPYAKEVFIKNSVDLVPGSNWVPRYEKAAAQAVEVLEASKQSGPGGSISYEFANLLLHGLASVRAEQLETKLAPLAVWDGKSGDGAGGTAATVEHWRERGLGVEIIDLREIQQRAGVSIPSPTASSALDSTWTNEPRPDFATQIRALLFADAEGFSKLGDVEVPRFVKHFLGLVGKLADEPAHKPLTKNTWGDGLYFVFEKVRDAGQFALDLRDRVRSTDWTAKGLPNLNLRIGLHAGPVYSCTDPVTQRPSFFGAHVSRAARIEPITPTGQVYASQAFAALAAAEGVEEFRCDYVGQTSMAKKYGTYPTYVVLRCRVPKPEAPHPPAAG
jgi:class 3 adenylate cyclase